MKIKVELYFQKSEAELRGQWIGEYTASVSADGSVRLGAAKTISPKGETTYYMERGMVFERILPENLELLVRAFEKEFQEKYEIIIRDSETDALISEMLERAEWEKF